MQHDIRYCKELTPWILDMCNHLDHSNDSGCSGDLDLSQYSGFVGYHSAVGCTDDGTIEMPSNFN